MEKFKKILDRGDKLIYITGDTHIPIDISKLNMRKFPEQKNMTRNDFIIICGDFGGVWSGSNEDKYWIKWLSEKNFTTLFVDGNHENHKMLNEYSVDFNFGGKVHKIADSVYHLMRGEVYILDGKKIFTMGGASSRDKIYRRENISWWPEELPSNDEYDNAINNLNVHDWCIDYIISHCCADSTMAQISNNYGNDKLTNFFEQVIKTGCLYNRWYFGHYHRDIVIDEKHICVYNKIIRAD